MATKARSRAKKAAAPRGGATTEWKDTMGRVWLAGLGALAQAGDKGRQVLDDLAESGPDLRELGKKGMDTAREKVGEARTFAGDALNKLESLVDAKVASALDRVGVPSRDEIRHLSQRVADLSAKVERLRPTRPTRARR